MTTTDQAMLLDLAVPPGWRLVPLWALFVRSKLLGHTEEAMLSVFREHGVVQKDSLPNLNKTAEDRSIYQLVDKGWLVVNRMKAFRGSVGIAFQRGIVSGHYICFRPAHSESARYLNWLLRSDVYRTVFHRLSRGVRPGQIEIDNDYLRSVPVLLPPLDVQRRIADFLDDQVARMDKARELRERQEALLEDSRRASLVQVFFEHRKDLPAVRLKQVAVLQHGRQRSPEHESGDFMTPYMRSANVSDGRLVLEDVKEMNFDPAERVIYGLDAGDVLVTEASGSAASIGASCRWMGEIPAPVCFQNHVIRLRPRGDAVTSGYLYWWARASYASGAMRIWATGANILNLGSDALGRMPVPARGPEDQSKVVARCEDMERLHANLRAAVGRSRSLLAERKRSLITAAVTGQFDVSSASQRATAAVLIGAGGAG